MSEVFCIDTIEDFRKLQAYVNECKEEYIVIDVETDSISEKKALIFGVGICFNEQEAFYIPVRTVERNLVWGDADLAIIVAWLRDIASKHRVLTYNGLYDCLVIENNFGFTIDIHTDVMMLKHSVDETRPFGLKEVAEAIWPGSNLSQQRMKESVIANGGTVTKDNFTMWKCDTSILANYCGHDCILTYKLFEHYLPKLKAEGLEKFFYVDEVMPLYKEVTIEMKRHGMPIDVAHFEKLRTDISRDIEALEEGIYEAIAEDIEEFELALLSKSYPIKRTGTYPKVLAEICGVALPMNGEKVSLARKGIEKLHAAEPNKLYAWLLGEDSMDDMLLKLAQRKYAEKDLESSHIFNIGSNDHLAWLLFDKLRFVPDSKTDTGKPQVDAEYLESLVERVKWMSLLVDYKKLQKLLSTYVEGILGLHIDGVIYTSLLQHGTTSGRYSSTSPNLQNLYRVKDEESNISPEVLKYANAIKEGFVAPTGYKIVNSDFSSLEPVCFSVASGDEMLQEVFRKGHDLYSSIAIEMKGCTEYSADKKADNYLGKHRKELRQLAKSIALAIPYGSEAGRVSQMLNCNYQEAQDVIDNYLSAYPGLHNFMKRREAEAKTIGRVVAPYGRIRHLPEAKILYERYGDKLLDRKFCNKNGLGDTRYKYKNALNQAKNFTVQSTAATICNRAMIAVNRKFKKLGLDAHVSLQCHDEITCLAREDQALLVKDLLRECMEHTTEIGVPLKAEPVIADNLAEAK